MTEYEKMLNGVVFDAGDVEISAVRDRAFELVYQIRTAKTFAETQTNILKDLKFITLM